MRVDMNDSDGPVCCNAFQYRISDRMISADRQRDHSCSIHVREIVRDLLDGIFEIVEIVDWDIADIRNGAEFVRLNAGRNIDASHQGRCIADLPGTVSRTRPVGDAEIRRNTDERDIEALNRLHNRRPHEARDAREPWPQHGRVIAVGFLTDRVFGAWFCHSHTDIINGPRERRRKRGC